ncbi:unnamed protein product [Diplocarpon coronariae]
MERHRRADKRPGEGKELPQGSSSRHRRQHHRNSREPDRRAFKDSPSAKTRPGRSSGKLSKDMGTLSGNNEYIRTWLAQIASNDHQDTTLVNRPVNSSKLNDVEAHGAASDFRPAAHIYEDERRSTYKCKRRHKSSSDSSLLEAPIRLQRNDLKSDDPHPTISQRQNHPTAQEKPQVDHSDTGGSSHTSSRNPPRETFEKRIRHKTREDRYEPKKKVRSGKDGVQNTSKKRRVKRGDRRKAAKKSGEELMQNFSSTNVARDRLTMRPSNGPGLFKNGRASSPARRRGLPDLAFSEMDFLQHTNRKGPVESRERVTSKSLEREKRKTTRAQEEISTFFGPINIPLQEVSTNRTGRSTSRVNNELPIYAKQSEQDQDQKMPSYERSESFDFQQEQSCGKERPSQPSHEKEAHRSYPRAASQPMKDTGSTSKLSSKAMSTVSWSESQVSPAITPRQTVLDRLSASPTPASVWKSIENTGIFEGTGIEITPNRRRTGRSSMTMSIYESQMRDQVQVWKGLSERIVPTTTTADSSEVRLGIPEVGLPGREGSVGYERSLSLLESRAQPENDTCRAQIDTSGNVAGSRQRIVVEHFNPQLGWHEEPNAIYRNQQTSAVAMRKEITGDCGSTPLSRDEIAKHARIKLPKRSSTTIPLVNDEAGESRKVIGPGIFNSRTLQTPINDDSQVIEEHLENAIGWTQSAAPLLRFTRVQSDPSDPKQCNTEQEIPARRVVEEKPLASVSDSGMPSEWSEQPRFDAIIADKQHSSGPRLLHPHVRFQLSEETSLGGGPENESEAYGMPYISDSWIGDVRPWVTVKPSRISPVSEVKPFFIHQLQQNLQYCSSYPYQESNRGVAGTPLEQMDTETFPHDEDCQVDDIQYLEGLLEPTTRRDGGECPGMNEACGEMNVAYADRSVNRDPELYHDEEGFVGHILAEEEAYDCEHVYEPNQGERFNDNLGIVDAHEQFYRAEACGGYDIQVDVPRAGFWQPRPRY